MTRINDLIDHQAEFLRVLAQRQQLLASNIANADTPGYQAVDLDFTAALDHARAGRLSLATTQAGHLLPASRGGAGGAQVQYRMPSQPSLDGNTVEADREVARFADNALAYQARAQFLDGTIRTLRLAITGTQS